MEKPRLLLKVRRNLPLPFIPPKQMMVDLSDVAIDQRTIARMGTPYAEVSPEGDAIVWAWRRLQVGLYRFFNGVRQFWFFDGILRLQIRGKSGIWKLDTNGWLLEDGQALQELVKISDLDGSIYD